MPMIIIIISRTWVDAQLVTDLCGESYQCAYDYSTTLSKEILCLGIRKIIFLLLLRYFFLTIKIFKKKLLLLLLKLFYKFVFEKARINLKI